MIHSAKIRCLTAAKKIYIKAGPTQAVGNFVTVSGDIYFKPHILTIIWFFLNSLKIASHFHKVMTYAPEMLPLLFLFLYTSLLLPSSLVSAHSSPAPVAVISEMLRWNSILAPCPGSQSMGLASADREPPGEWVPSCRGKKKKKIMAL